MEEEQTEANNDSSTINKDQQLVCVICKNFQNDLVESFNDFNVNKEKNLISIEILENAFSIQLKYLRKLVNSDIYITFTCEDCENELIKVKDVYSKFKDLESQLTEFKEKFYPLIKKRVPNKSIEETINNTGVKVELQNIEEQPCSEFITPLKKEDQLVIFHDEDDNFDNVSFSLVGKPEKIDIFPDLDQEPNLDSDATIYSDVSLDESSDSDFFCEDNSEEDPDFEFKGRSLRKSNKKISDKDKPESEDEDRDRGKKYHCPELNCNKKFVTKSGFKRHLLNHSNPKIEDDSNVEYKCTECPRVFTQLKKWNNHKQSHVKEECPECHKLIQKVTFSRHLRIHKGEKVFKCPACDESFFHSSAKSSHIAKVHPDIAKFKCPYTGCERAFVDSRAKRDHVMAIHTLEKPFKCKECGKGFRDRFKLKNHISDIHEHDKVACDQCGKILNRTYLTVHIKNVHSGRSFTCEVCGESMTIKSSLDEHMKIHAENRTRCNICHICGKAYFEKRTLNIHLRTHQEQKPYKCPDCPRAFVTSNKLKIHRTLHGDSRPFQCNICQKSFTDNFYLYMHKRSHQKDATKESQSQLQPTSTIKQDQDPNNSGGIINTSISSSSVIEVEDQNSKNKVKRKANNNSQTNNNNNQSQSQTFQNPNIYAAYF